MSKQPVLEIFVITASLLGILFMFHNALAHGTTVCTEVKTSLSQGSKGADVTSLQAFLHTQDLLQVEPTGYFGPVTVKAVKDFQASQHISTVGVVGPQTRAAIKTVSCAQAPVTNPTPTPLPPSVIMTPASVAPTATGVSLPYHAPQFSGWSGTWGDVSTTDTGALLLKAGTSTTGAEAVLPGSNNWSNYRVTANVLTRSTDILMFARFVDSKNFVMCVFSDNFVTIKQRLNGVDQVVASGQAPNMPGGLSIVRSTSVAMRVKGNTVGCSESGPDDNVVFNSVDPSLSKGGIGFDIWNQNVNFSSMELRSIDVAAL